MDKARELEILTQRIAYKEAELIECKQWITDNLLGIPSSVLLTFTEGEVAKEMNLKRLRERIEKLKE